MTALFVQACNSQGIANMARMSSTRSRYSVITFLRDRKAMTSHHTIYGRANEAFRTADKDSNTHMYDNVLRMCIRRKK